MKIATIFVMFVLLAGVGGVLFFTDSLGGVIYFFAAPKLCEITPSDSDCFCLETQDKLVYERFARGDKYFCENKDKVINIDVAGWEDEAKALAVQKFAEQFPDCDMGDCQDGRIETEFVLGAGISVGGVYDDLTRTVLVECNQIGVFGARFSSINLDIVTGTTKFGRCGSYSDVITDDPVPEEYSPFEFDTINPSRWDFSNGYISINGLWSSDCDKDNGIGISTVYSPYEDAVTTWRFDKYFIGDDSCSFIEETSNYATVKCERSCPSNVGFTDFTVKVIGELKPEFIDTYTSSNCIDKTIALENSYKCVSATFEGRAGWDIYFDLSTGGRIDTKISTMQQCQSGEFVDIAANLCDCVGETGVFRECAEGEIKNVDKSTQCILGGTWTGNAYVYDVVDEGEYFYRIRSRDSPPTYVVGTCENGLVKNLEFTTDASIIDNYPGIYGPTRS